MRGQHERHDRAVQTKRRYERPTVTVLGGMTELVANGQYSLKPA